MINDYKIFRTKDFVEFSWQTINYKEFAFVSRAFKNLGIEDFIIGDKSIMIFDSNFNEERIKDLNLYECNIESVSHEILVNYEGSDLDSVCEYLKIDREAFVKRHTEQEYYVCFNGFIAGFVYLGSEDSFFNIPRKDRAVPITKGAVAIANGMTGIYPQDSPGGWHVIGHTTFINLNLKKPNFMTLMPGDMVKFINNG
jgi:KipI family sensor histidine kinase inhibitor